MTYRKKDIFSIVLKVLLALVLILLILSIVKTCSDCERQPQKVKKVVVIRHTGYDPDKEDWDNIPDIIPPYDVDSLDRLDSIDSLADRVMLEQFFPPIGDQGQRGTCVAWATGYNIKTALNAIQNKWTPEQLADPAYQTSPKDLWYGIRSHGSNCNGANFEPACEALIHNGAATMKQVPYGDMRPCEGTCKGDAGNTLASYGTIYEEGGTVPSVQIVKAYLRDSIPLLFGARLGSEFMACSSADVIRSDTYNYTGMHQYHAMALVGYDDSLHAFRIRNSWGTHWGDEGSAWVDYDFFLNKFCIGLFVLKNGEAHPETVSQTR